MNLAHAESGKGVNVELKIDGFGVFIFVFPENQFDKEEFKKEFVKIRDRMMEYERGNRNG
jgi:hypothetical protein